MAIDLTTKMQVPDYRLPPEVYALLAQAVQQKNQQFQGLGQAMGQAGGLGVGAYQQYQKRQQMQNDPNMPDELKQFGKYFPGQEGQLYGEILKSRNPKPEYSVVPGMLSKTGHPFIQNKFTGDLSESDKDAVATGGSLMSNVREKQFTMQDLPSNQGPNTAAGAAYQVKVAARQGKNLIAKSGSSQRLGLAQGDLARAVLRNSPTDEAMRNANFSDNTINRWNQIKQKITSDPQAANNPLIRKEMYDIFDEMDRSATPFIQNQLDDMESVGFKIPANVRKRQMGLTLPDIPFIEVPGQATNTGDPLGIR